MLPGNCRETAKITAVCQVCTHVRVASSAVVAVGHTQSVVAVHSSARLEVTYADKLRTGRRTRRESVVLVEVPPCEWWVAVAACCETSSNALIHTHVHMTAFKSIFISLLDRLLL